MASSSDSPSRRTVVLVSEDGEATILVPAKAAEAYLPSKQAWINKQLSSSFKGDLMLLIILDGVTGALLETIMKYQAISSKRLYPSDEEFSPAAEETHKLWTKDFVANLSNETFTMLKDEVTKRKVTGEVMLQLKKALEYEFCERNSR